MTHKLSYHQTVNYDQADPMKVFAQKQGLATVKNMPPGLEELDGTRGESAYVFAMGTQWGALVQEGLGTKSLVAQAVYEQSDVSHFDAIAHDTVGCIINDLVSVGATPVVLNAYWSASSYEWLTDKTLAENFITGWRKACDAANVVWGGGETQALSGVVTPGALEFAGSAFGIITEEKRLVRGGKLTAGDAVVLIESNGVHANGISLIRSLAERLPQGYATKLPNGQTFGEAVLQPSHLYAVLVDKLFTEGLDVHYLSNITGHGWRKIMRADAAFTYRMHLVPEVSELFSFIQTETANSTEEMYGNYNMGAGYAVYLPADQAEKAVAAAKSVGLRAWSAGTVETGAKQVIIEPLGVTFGSESLEVR